MKSIWKDIPGYEGLYQINKFGMVRNSRGKVKATRLNKGYVLVNLSKKNKQKTEKVHRLVLYAFLKPMNLQVNHINGIKTDNRLENLEYSTCKKNNIHSIVNGLRKTKLQKNDIYQIRELLNSKKYKQIEIAKQFNISETTISKIKIGKAWGYI